jgi:hypothetical protein
MKRKINNKELGLQILIILGCLAVLSFHFSGTPARAQAGVVVFKSANPKSNGTPPFPGGVL